jgi:Domain of unknown function (DUF4123)
MTDLDINSSVLRNLQGAVYLLVDPYAGDPAPFAPDIPDTPIANYDELANLRARAWQGRPVYIYPDAEPLLDALRMPYVVELMPNDPLLDTTLKMAHARYADSLVSASQGGWLAPQIGGWLSTTLSPQQLMQRLHSMWTFRAHGGLQDKYLRVGDWRVMQLISSIFSPEATRDFLGPISSWFMPSRNGGLEVLKGWPDSLSEEQQFASSAISQENLLQGARLRLDRKNLTHLMCSEAINRTLCLWHCQLQDMCAQNPQNKVTLPIDAMQRAYDAIQVARIQGLEEPDDLAHYAQHWLTQGDVFVTQIYTKQAIARVSVQRKLQPVSFADALAQQNQILPVTS